MKCVEIDPVGNDKNNLSKETDILSKEIDIRELSLKNIDDFTDIAKKIAFSKSKKNISSFISILYKNGVSLKTYLTKEEQLILKTAVFHNYGIVNLLNPKRSKSIQNLFNKGLLTIYDNDSNKKESNNKDINNGLVKVVDELVYVIGINEVAGYIKIGYDMPESKMEDIGWYMDIEEINKISGNCIGNDVLCDQLNTKSVHSYDVIDEEELLW